MKHVILVILLTLAAPMAAAMEIHVSISGNDAGDGSAAKPLRTISAAAQRAQAGDVITVHQGVYRERIAPPRGGESDARRIVYQAATGERVEIAGSEVVRNWTRVQNDVWTTTVPNTLFGSFNPYSDVIHGDWFDPKGRTHHTGAVYVNGQWLAEAATLDDVMKPVGELPLWFGQVDEQSTTLWAQFRGVDPNQQVTEINVRRTVFYPEKPGINYITVRGFVLRDAATPWAPPTAEQIGLIGTHWSRGWIIENNVIRHSICSGIALGKYGDEFDNTSANTAEGYVKTIERALANGWNRDTVGHHVVRNNDISYCEQTGIVGSMGAAFSAVTGNTIHDIHYRRLFTGAEMAGIKFHGAIDVTISRNHIYRCCLAIWLDWMAQGARVSRNLLHDNLGQDLFLEVDHGPVIVDNNLLLSEVSVLCISQGVAWIHNLYAGGIIAPPFDERQTPYHKPHSTELAGMQDNPRGDDRYYNNIFLDKADLSQYDEVKLPVFMAGNVFVGAAKPSKNEANPLVDPNHHPLIQVETRPDGVYLTTTFEQAWTQPRQRQLIDTALLGRAAIPKVLYENPDGSPIRISEDYFGSQRDPADPMPGPFADPGNGRVTLKVWSTPPAGG